MQKLQQIIDYVYRFPEVNTCDETLKILSIHIEWIKPFEIEFDLIGLKPYVVNAIRQTILNEIPTMAIDEVYFHKNTSMFNCDYISQRLALIPITVDSTLFKFKSKTQPECLNSHNCIVFNINKKNTESHPIKVYSGDFEFQPVGSWQQTMVHKIKPLYPNIPICILKSNEELSCRLHCIKGIGITHMKFSPGFARYSFHSQITLHDVNKMTNETVMRLISSFPSGVISLQKNKQGQLIPFVDKERLDRHTRSYKNFNDVARSVEVKYYRDHLIFTVESYGVIEPVDIVINALNIMIYKYETLKQNIQECIKKWENKAN